MILCALNRGFSALRKLPQIRIFAPLVTAPGNFPVGTITLTTFMDPACSTVNMPLLGCRETTVPSIIDAAHTPEAVR